MKVLFSLLTILLMAAPAMAISVKGYVFLDENQNTCIQLHGEDQKLKLRGKTSALDENLKNLKPGDFISGGGRIELASGTLVMYSIEHVGLKRVLGKWVSTNGDLFNFKDFTSLELKFLAAPSGLYQIPFVQSPEPSQSVTYQLGMRSEESGWPILFLGELATGAGELVYESEEKIHLVIYNLESGDLIHRYELRPFIEPEK